MTDLLNKKCVPCEGGILPFDISEIHKKNDFSTINKSGLIEEIANTIKIQNSK